MAPGYHKISRMRVSIMVVCAAAAIILATGAEATGSGGTVTTARTVTYRRVSIRGTLKIDEMVTVAWQGKHSLVRTSDGSFSLGNPPDFYTCAPTLEQLKTTGAMTGTAKPNVCAHFVAGEKGHAASSWITLITLYPTLDATPFQRGLLIGGGQFDKLKTISSRSFGRVGSTCRSGQSIVPPPVTIWLCAAKVGGYMTYYNDGYESWTLTSHGPAFSDEFKLPVGVKVLSLAASLAATS